MELINSSDSRLKYPGFYNIYPIRNEIRVHSQPNEKRSLDNIDCLLDNFYGRILNSNIKFHYGKTSSLNYYSHYKEYKIVDELRVPFRRVPIYEYENVEQVQTIFNRIESENSSHEILLRGQTSIYTIERTEEEADTLFGETKPKEPSFLPSFLRSKFNEFFIYSMWHSQTALMLNDVGVDLSKIINAAQLSEYREDVYKIKHSSHFTPIALGFAQHYGLPSVGLDLTKDVKVASWFASNKLNVASNGKTMTSKAPNFNESTIFIFRCPKDSVFSYKLIKPKFICDTRPDRQDAWFGHVGWGCAKNELASFLVCGIRLNDSILDFFEANYEAYLFPDREKDLVLNYFLDAASNKKYKGEAERVLKKIYSL
jgi:hypothetical protein